MDVGVLLHVADGMLVGRNLEVHQLIEQVSNQVMIRIPGQLEQLNDQVFFLDRVIVRTARGLLGRG